MRAAASPHGRGQGQGPSPAAPAAPAGPGACSGESGTRPGTRRVPARGSGRQPRGSRIGDVTSGRIVRGGLARIERRRISSRWARTARGGVDCVALGSHYASRVRPAPAPASPGIGLCRSESRRGSGRGGGEGYSEVVLKTWSVKVVVMVRSDESSSSEGLLQRRPSASPGCDARGRLGRWGVGVGCDGPLGSPPGALGGRARWDRRVGCRGRPGRRRGRFRRPVPASPR